jgi:hypothetical protein
MEMYEEMKRSKEENAREKDELKKEIKSLKKNLKNLMKQKQPRPPSSDNYLSLIQFKAEGDDLDKNLDLNLEEQIQNQSDKLKPEINDLASSLDEELIRMRESLCELMVGDEVLGKSNDDGWYYKCIVKEHYGSHRYKLEDTGKNAFDLYREDIVSEQDAVNHMIQV